MTSKLRRATISPMQIHRLTAIGVATIALAVPAAQAGTSVGPAIRPVKTSPLQAHGVRFKPHERVRVRLESPTITATRRIVVGAGGTFTATFTGIAVDRCLGYSLSAVGSLGDRATWSMKLPLPACNPA
jgi:hypothetical protein